MFGNILFIARFVYLGIALFAAIHHLLLWGWRGGKRLHAIFALLCLLLAAYLSSFMGLERAVTVSDYVAVSRFQGYTVLVYWVVFIWLIAEFTGIKPRAFLWVFTAALELHFILFYRPET